MQNRKRFGEILVEAGIVSRETLEAALQKQRGTGRPLGQVLEWMGVLTEQNIAAALARQFGFKTVSNIARASFSTELLGLVDAETAAGKLIFPLRVEKNSLFLAMVNPLDMATIDNLAFSRGLRIVPCVTTPSEVLAAIDRHYHKIADPSSEGDDWWTVLVVDDQDQVRAAAMSALKTEGFGLLEASNGADGLKMALQYQPHLVIADTVMPRMDGYEMFRGIKGNPGTRHIPVIALSSRSSAEEEAQLLDIGYADFIAKPINPVRLVARVKHALRLSYGEKPPAR